MIGKGELTESLEEFDMYRFYHEKTRTVLGIEGRNERRNLLPPK